MPYNGNYTITIRSNGFKEFSKSFKVTGGEDVSSKQAAVVYQSAAYDVMTHATGSGSGGGSGRRDGSSCYQALEPGNHKGEDGAGSPVRSLCGSDGH